MADEVIPIIFKDNSQAMKRNRLLRVALALGKASRILILFGIAVVIFLFIHWKLDPDFYRTVQFTIHDGGITFTERISAGEAGHLPGSHREKWFYLNSLTPLSVTYTFVQILLSLVLGYLMVQSMIRILKSTQALQPFHEANINAFRKLGYFCLALLVLNSFRFLATDQASSIRFHINFTLLVFMLASFILAEIFREGQKLYEQEKLTI
jgi:hypothetical protein